MFEPLSVYSKSFTTTEARFVILRSALGSILIFGNDP